MYDVVVLGAGVIGLSIARELDDKGYKVAVVARDLPEDGTSTGFASPWAGCNWFSFEADGSCPAAEWDRITFKRLEKLAAEHPELCKRIPFWNVWDRKKNEPKPWYDELVGGTTMHEATAAHPLPGKKRYGVSFSSYIINAPGYLSHLGQTLRTRGIPLIRRRLASLDEAYDIPGIGPVTLVVNALALGSAVLIGVEDDKMYPARGQTVLVRAPWVTDCTMHTEGFNAPPLKPGEPPLPEPAYIIPRPGPEGHVVLGGTYIRNNFSTLPSLSEAERILRACYDLDPRLAGPNGKSWRDIEVVAHNVGLRPARDGGARLEIEEREIGAGSKGGKGMVQIAPRSGREGTRKKVAVVHAYGAGGAGYQSSMGVAEKVTELVNGWFKQNANRAKL